ncbi:unnamed protein product, partial [Pocillopora meandrina]
MQASWLTQFVFVTLYIFLVFVVANRDFCANVLETQVAINRHEAVSVGIYRLRLNLDFNTLVAKKGSSSQDSGCSRKNIRNTGNSTGNGEYPIDLEKNENPLK